MLRSMGKDVGTIMNIYRTEDVLNEWRVGAVYGMSRSELSRVFVCVLRGSERAIDRRV